MAAHLPQGRPDRHGHPLGSCLVSVLLKRAPEPVVE
jgi:hypothetical protein